MKPPEEENPAPTPGPSPNMRTLRVRGGVPLRAFLLGAGCALGLFLLTGLSPSPWLFLLYPPLLAGLVFAFAALALHFLRHL